VAQVYNMSVSLFLLVLWELIHCILSKLKQWSTCLYTLYVQSCFFFFFKYTYTNSFTSWSVPLVFIYNLKWWM